MSLSYLEQVRSIAKKHQEFLEKERTERKKRERERREREAAEKRDKANRLRTRNKLFTDTHKFFQQFAGLPLLSQNGILVVVTIGYRLDPRVDTGINLRIRYANHSVSNLIRCTLNVYNPDEKACFTMSEKEYYNQKYLYSLEQVRDYVIPIVGKLIDPEADDREIEMRKACLKGDEAAKGMLHDYLLERNRLKKHPIIFIKKAKK